MTRKKEEKHKKIGSLFALCFLRHLFGECVNKRVSSFEQAEVEKAENEHRDKCSLLPFVGISFHYSKGLSPFAKFWERMCDAAAPFPSPRYGSQWQADARRRNHRTFEDADVTRLKVFLLSAEGDQETLRGEGGKKKLWVADDPF